MSHDLGASYGFTTLNPQLRVINDDKAATPVACVSIELTPALGASTANLLTYLPLAVLILVGVATASAAVFSPWGTSDVFRWTSNYGRDADQLRLITPGFGDCLQYIQFVFLSGCLSLNYPGFYQPAVSAFSWSALVFNQSFVSTRRDAADSHGPVGLIDGLYVTNATYGLDSVGQLVGLANDRNLWAGAIVWLLVILAAVTVLIELGFAARWAYRHLSRTREGDLRAKNLPFAAGNAIRIVFNYFLFPLVALSMYQLVLTPTVLAEGSSVAPVVLAVLTMVALLAFCAWLFAIITRANPRSYLFDDLPTVLLYGPLYNTYSDHKAGFALVPVLLALVRGVAVGAVQPSGVAQLVLLAMCEVVLLLTLNTVRPFSSPTSMNAYHTIFAATRLLATLLMVAFVPPLQVDPAPRGWIGYVILLLHALALFVGFFLHSLQTLIEVVARRAGAGGEDVAGGSGSAARGGLVKVFGVRQLSRRDPRKVRSSGASEALMLQPDDATEPVHHTGGTRSRSISASSGLLLSGRPSDHRKSVGVESSVGGAAHSASGSVGYTPTTPGPRSSTSGAGLGRTRASSGAGAGLRAVDAADPFFRPPRARRPTAGTAALELAPSPGARSRGSWASGDWTKVSSPERPDSPELVEGPSISGRGTPQPAYLSAGVRERADSAGGDSAGKPKPDYATREVDYFYGVRGPALSHMPTRRLKTGPADPTGPVSSATGWFKGLFGGKTKDKAKGFEVVRSARVPPQEHARSGSSHGGGGDEEMGEAVALEEQGPYRDDPAAEGIPKTRERPRDLELDDEGDAVGGGTRRLPSAGGDGARGSLAPTLPDIDAGASIHMPSRYASRSSTRPSRQPTQREAAADITSARDMLAESDDADNDGFVPAVPRRSSKRTSSAGSGSPARLSVIPASPLGTPRHASAASTPARTPGHTHSVSASAAPDWPLGPATTNVTLTPPQPSSASVASGSGASQRLPFGNGRGLDPERAARHTRTHSSGSVASAVSALSAVPSERGDGRPPSPLAPHEHAAPHGPLHTAAGRPGAAGDTESLGPPPRIGGGGTAGGGERPGSVGFVPQHRASDGLRVVERGSERGWREGAVAEWVDEGERSG